MKALIIESSPDMRNLMRLVLQRAGMDVVVASNGCDGLVQAKLEVPNVIALDLDLPDMQGVKVCLELKIHPLSKNIPVVMISGHLDQGTRVASIAAGADDYITKPFSVLTFSSIMLHKCREIPDTDSAM